MPTVAVFVTACAAIVACGTVYQPPAETSIYIGVTTVQNTISNIGSRLTYSSNQIDGFLQYLLFSTWEGSVTASGSVHSDRNGKYYLLNAKVPANWFWNYESGVCAGHGDDNDFYKGNVFDLVCTVVISSAYAYGFSADGSPVYTGGNDKSSQIVGIRISIRAIAARQPKARLSSATRGTVT